MCFMKDKICSIENLVTAIWDQLTPHLPGEVQLHCLKLLRNSAHICRVLRRLMLYGCFCIGEKSVSLYVNSFAVSTAYVCIRGNENFINNFCFPEPIQ